jgi:DNA-binding MarR family transcriptional regulator
MNGERKVVRAIERANQRVRRHLAEHLTRLDISEIEAHLVARLSAKGPCSVAELQKALGLRPSTLTNALDRLEERGFVKRKPNPSDRRSFVVTLTAAGSRASSQVIELVDDLEARIASRVSRAQLETFHAVVAAVEDSLE